ncbi:hypothetical protein Tco_1522461 [Tanacetum coccineum]
MSVRQVWKRKTSTQKPSSSFQSESPLLPLQTHHQSISPPSYNPSRDEMINSLHNILTILDTHNNPSNAYTQAPPSPPPQKIYPPSHGQVDFYYRELVDIMKSRVGYSRSGVGRRVRFWGCDNEGPSVGSDQGLKRQRTSKGTETSKKTSISKDSSKGKSTSSSSKSSKSGKSAKDELEEPIFVQDSDYATHDDAEFDYADMQLDQGEDLGKTDGQPNDEDVPKYDWYKKSRSDTSPDPEWNECRLVDDGPEQSWLNDMAKATKPPLTFDELMHTPIDISAFGMNRLKIDNLTKEHLVGPVYNLLKGSCKSYVELDYTMEECYRALSEQLDWKNPKGHRYPYDLTKPLLVQMTSQGRQIVPADFFFKNDLEYLRGGSNDKKYTASTTKSKAERYELQGIEDMVPNLWSPVKHDVYSTKRIMSVISVKVNEWYGYGHLEEIVLKRADQQLYTFKEVHLAASLCMFARRTVIQARVEDLQLGVESYQKNLNLTKPRTRYVDMSHRPAYTTVSDPQVHDTLAQMLHELHLGYNKAMRRRKWTLLDQQRTCIMIKATNQNLLDRRIMRSLKKFVGGREYGEDLRLLQWTI